MFKFLISVFIYIRQIVFFPFKLAYLYHTFYQYAVTKNYHKIHQKRTVYKMFITNNGYSAFL